MRGASQMRPRLRRAGQGGAAPRPQADSPRDYFGQKKEDPRCKV